MSRIVPVGNKILVRPLEKKDEVINGIIHSAVANADLSEGLVVEVSQDLAGLFMPDQKVLFNTAAGVGQFYRGAHHRWLSKEEVWGTVSENLEG